MFLELGVGFNTPSFIRILFERMANTHPDASLICSNKDDVRSFVPDVDIIRMPT